MKLKSYLYITTMVYFKKLIQLHSLILPFYIFFASFGVGWATEYYASPMGGGDGTSVSDPYRISDFWSNGHAKPGNRLYLLNGTYTGSNSMITPPAGISGTAAQPIRISAFNDGKVTINGEFTRTPVKLSQNNYFILEGFNACNSNDRVVWLYKSNHCVVRRICAWDGNPNTNSDIFHASGTSDDVCEDVVFEDCAGWGSARKIFGRYNDRQVTFRRCFFRWTYYVGHAGGTYSMGMTFAYKSTESLIENCIGTWDEHPVTANVSKSGIFGVDGTVADGDYRIFGCIGYQLSEQKEYPNNIFSFHSRDPNTNYTLENCIAFTEKSDKVNPFNLQEMSFTGSHLTCIGGGNGYTGSGLFIKDQNGTVDYCISSRSEKLGTNEGTNYNYMLFWDNAGGNYEGSAPQNFITEHPQIIDNGSNILQYGMNETDRPQVAGEPVGAQLQYRYVDGEITEEPLWPWPMNHRIRAAIIESGYHKKGGLDGAGGLNLTKIIFELGGGNVPAELSVSALNAPENFEIIEKKIVGIELISVDVTGDSKKLYLSSIM